MTIDSGPFVPGWQPSPPDYRDYSLRSRLPRILGLAAPTSIASLTKGVIPILDQGNLGSCTAFASGRAFRYIDNQDTVSFDVSELSQYWNSRYLMGEQYVNVDSGAYNRDAAKALAMFGQAPEPEWPYIISKFTQRPPQAAYDRAAGHKAVEYISVPNDVETMKQVIAAGFPIVIGFTVYSNYTQGLSTGIWPEAGGSAIGGHAVLVDGYEPGWWWFANSWGAGVGQQGWFKMSWNYLIRNGDDFWTYKKVTADVIEPEPEPEPGPTPQRYWTDFYLELKANDQTVDYAAGKVNPPQ